MKPACPSCGDAYEGKEPYAEWLTCAGCGNIWQLSEHPASRVPSESRNKTTEKMGHDTLEAIKVETGKKGGLAKTFGSDEYLPGTGAIQRSKSAAALTARVAGATPGIREAIERVVAEGESNEIARTKSATPVAESPAAPPVEDSSLGGIKLDLFDQIEQEIDEERGAELTQAVDGFGGSDGFEPQVLPAGDASVSAPTTPVSPPSPAASPPPAEPLDDDRGRQLTEEALVDDEPIDIGRDPLIGAEVAGCVIDRKLGEGGMGSVYHATQVRLDRSVAIKVLPPEMKRNTKFLKRFEHEAKSLARINHPNILHIYDFGEAVDIGLYYMVMEFVDGEDLAEVLARERQLDQRRVLELLQQSLTGLECAAEAGVVHRDIKPDNLMLTADGICKISDFGLAKDAAAMTQVTNMGVRVGTPAFMSPEQCDGETLDWRSDVYSLGVTFYVCLTGSLPFSGESPFAIMLKHKTEPPPGICERAPATDVRVELLIHQMMAKDPAARGADVAAIRKQVRGLIEALAGGDVQTVQKGSTKMVEAVDAPMAFGPVESGDGLPPLPKDMMAGTPAAPPMPAAPVIPSPTVAPQDPPAARDLPPLPAAPAPRSTPPPANRVPSPPQNRPPSGPMASSGLNRAPSGVQEGPGSKRSSGVRRQGDVAKPSRRSGRRELPGRPQSEVFKLEEEGDRLLADGKHKAAIKAWQKAAQLGGQWQVREALFRKIERAQIVLRSRSRRRMAVLVFLVIGALGAGGWLVTPNLHRTLAERAYQTAKSEPTDSSREEALLLVIDRFSTPAIWCKMFGHMRVPTPAVESARKDVEQLRGERDTKIKHQRVRQELAALEAALGIDNGTWDAILQHAKILQSDELAGQLPAESLPFVQQAEQDAQEGIDDYEGRLKAIEQQLAGGDVSAAIAGADGLRSVPRLTTAQRQTIPQGQVFAVTGVDGERIPGLQVAIDGVPVTDFKGLGYRRLDRAMELTLSAAGYVRVLAEVPAGVTDVEPLAFTLRQAVAWRRPLSRSPGKAPWSAFVPLDSDRVLLHSDRLVTCFDMNDGNDLWILPASLTDGSVRWMAPRSVSSQGMTLATSQGDVLRFAVANARSRPVPKRLQIRQHPVVARSAYEMTLQIGRQGQATLEQLVNGYGLFVQVGDEAVNASLVLQGIRTVIPALLHHQERLFVIDEDRVHVLEEDGRSLGGTNLDIKRTGPIEFMTVDNIVAVPSGAELATLDFGRAGDAVVIGESHWVTSDGRDIQALCRSGSQLVVLSAGGTVHLLDWDAKAANWQTRWQQRAWEQGTGGVWAGDGKIVAFNDHGAVQVYRSEANQAVFGYDHDQGVVSTAVVGDKLLLYDAGSSVLAFTLIDPDT